MIMVASFGQQQEQVVGDALCPYSPLPVHGITLIENVTEYKYIDMGQDTFMTLVIPTNAKPESPTFERK